MASDDSSGQGASSGRSRRERTRLIAGVALAVLLLAFILDNRTVVPIGFVFFDVHVRLIWILVGTALLGAALGQLVVRRRAKSKD